MPLLILLFDGDGDPLAAPGFGLFVGGEVDIDLGPFDRPTAIDDFYNLAIVIPGDTQFGSEGKQFRVGGDKNAIVVIDGFSAGGDPGCFGAATIGAGAIAGDFKPDDS